MKLRLRGNTLRLRITRSEVDRLLAGEVVAEVLPLAPNPLTYALGVADVPAIAASFEGARLEVLVPRALARDWLGSERVGVDAEQTSGGTPLHLLLEKDFACLTPRAGEDDA